MPCAFAKKALDNLSFDISSQVLLSAAHVGRLGQVLPSPEVRKLETPAIPWPETQQPFNHSGDLTKAKKVNRLSKIIMPCTSVSLCECLAREF